MNTEEFIPIFMGRWQPWHLGHHYVAMELLRRYGCLTIGIVNPDPENPTEAYERFHPRVNPFTYWQRLRLITAAISKESIEKESLARIMIVPIWGMATQFEREKCFLPPPELRLWVITDVREDSIDKIETLRRITPNVEVLQDIPRELAMIEARIIRSMIVHKDYSWKDLVPSETVSLLEQDDYLKALLDSHNKSWPPYLFTPHSG